MTWAAVAIAGGAIVGGIATTVAGQSAASATTDAANTAANVQLQALQQQKQLAAPYTQLGQAAIPQLQALLGIGPQGAGGIQAALQKTPGYQFAQQAGQQSINNASTLNSGPLSTGTLTGLESYASNLADQTYQQQLGNIFNTVGIGQAAAAGQAANIGNTASNLANIGINQGTNLANIDINQAAALSKIAGGVGNSAITLAALNNQNPPPQSPTAGLGG